MSPGPPSPVRPLELPASGAIRVHPEPAALPRLRREAAGRNRFDDPDGTFLVRYAAGTLHGCLVETMSRFRVHPAAEAVLSGISGVGDGDVGEATYAEPATSVVAWLADQQVGHLHVTSPEPLLVDVEAVAMLDRLDAHPRVRAALDASALGTAADPARLDAGIIRLGGPLGRPVTQAVSRAVYESVPGVDGLGYWSRLDPAERCWALYDHVPVDVEVTPLDPQRTTHRDAVRTVADRFGIRLIAPWA